MALKYSRFYKRLVELDQNYKNILIFYEENSLRWSHQSKPEGFNDSSNWTY